jgi:hypothetical protein
MPFLIRVWKGFSPPEPQGPPRWPLWTIEEAEAVCDRQGISLDVELADRGPDTVWATVETSSVGD